MSESEAEDLTVDAGSDPFPAISQRRRKGVRVTSAAAMALGLVLSGGAVAGAASTSHASTGSSRVGAKPTRPPFGGARPTAVGTVKSVGDGTFTITGQDGTTVTVDVGTTTSYFDPGVSSPTIANVKAGEHVAVFGTDSSGTVTATRVAIGTPPAGGKGGPPGGHGAPFGTSGGPAGGPPAAVGTVKSVGNGAFTITGQDGATVTVDVGTTTSYFDPGVSSPTIANVKAGEHVAVFGTDSSGTVTATRVAIGTPPAGGKGGPPGGPGGSRGHGAPSGTSSGPAGGPPPTAGSTSS